MLNRFNYCAMQNHDGKNGNCSIERAATLSAGRLYEEGGVADDAQAAEKHGRDGYERI